MPPTDASPRGRRPFCLCATHPEQIGHCPAASSRHVFPAPLAQLILLRQRRECVRDRLFARLVAFDTHQVQNFATGQATWMLADDLNDRRPLRSPWAPGVARRQPVGIWCCVAGREIRATALTPVLHSTGESTRAVLLSGVWTQVLRQRGRRPVGARAPRRPEPACPHEWPALARSLLRWPPERRQGMQVRKRKLRMVRMRMPTTPTRFAMALQGVLLRGEAENLIKAPKLHVASDGTSCTRASANQFRP